jgi:tetratricopeptide (TPR) repeat protein
MSIEFIPAICPNCGGELRVPEDRKIIKCMYCGYDIIMHETKNNSPQPSIENWFRLADALEISNPKEAYEYYKKILEVEPENWKAWRGKGKAAGRLATLGEPRFSEITNDFRMAIEYSPVDKKKEIVETTTFELFSLAANYISSSVDAYTKYNQTDQGYFQCIERIKLSFTIIDPILQAFPQHPCYVEFLNIAIGYSKMISESIRKGVNVNTTPKIEFWHKYQNYIKMMREVNPTYKPPL